MSFYGHGNGNGNHWHEAVEVPIFVFLRVEKSGVILELREEDMAGLAAEGDHWCNMVERCIEYTVGPGWMVEEGKAVLHTEIDNSEVVRDMMD